LSKRLDLAQLCFVRSLSIEEHRLVQAASGWLDLGLLDDAAAELAALPEDIQEHQEVLSVLWELYAKRKDWAAALATAQSLLASDSESPNGWIKQSYSLHELKRTQEAWNELVLVAPKFPNVSEIPYNLACYACQLGRLEQARRYLIEARRVVEKEGNARRFREIALADPDLAPMRDEIREL
jgi:tetratricopeptide (TPR) repeat protein